MPRGRSWKPTFWDNHRSRTRAKGAAVMASFDATGPLMEAHVLDNHRSRTRAKGAAVMASFDATGPLMEADEEEPQTQGPAQGWRARPWTSKQACLAAALALLGCCTCAMMHGGPRPLTLSQDVKAAISLGESAENLDFVGMGYNLLGANPLEPKDPGLTYHPIFQVITDKGKVSDGVSVQQFSSCQSNRVVNTIFGARSLVEDMAAHVGVDPAGISQFPYAFKASSAFHTMTSSMKHSKLVSNTAACSVYEATIDTSQYPPLDENFEQSLNDLAAEVSARGKVHDKRSFFKFLDNYGTHFLHSVTFGSKYEAIYRMTEDDQRRIEDKHTSLDAEVRATAEMDLTDNRRTHDMSRMQKYQVFTIGGKWNSNMVDWMKEAEKDPTPIRYGVKPIKDVLDDIAKTKTRLRKVIDMLEEAAESYCQEFKGHSRESCQAKLSDPDCVFDGDCPKVQEVCVGSRCREGCRCKNGDCYPGTCPKGSMCVEMVCQTAPEAFALTVDVDLSDTGPVELQPKLVKLREPTITGQYLLERDTRIAGLPVWRSGRGRVFYCHNQWQFGDLNADYWARVQAGVCYSDAHWKPHDPLYDAGSLHVKVSGIRKSLDITAAEVDDEEYLSFRVYAGACRKVFFRGLPKLWFPLNGVYEIWPDRMNDTDAMIGKDRSAFIYKSKDSGGGSLYVDADGVWWIRDDGWLEQKRVAYAFNSGHTFLSPYWKVCEHQPWDNANAKMW
eukprot:CAMPEP_0170227280 /NCGR_PEP_ID=MMETSP0116_2-20130129/13354_1 /TAXON_ID=400756 /ORGANISM="Durinskia baltica, Strain CSIRO CS-38" /LENGTH=726 /DNA_ID=CAMNT_0010478011 /DNA_START=1 /DNA_END=2179 /DNA_ORIENTATION=-